MALSGPEWVTRFPTSSSLNDLVEPFRTNASRFIAALRAAGAQVIVSDTLRPPERAHLMHYCFAIAKQGCDPGSIPAMPGLDIEWLHRDGAGRPDPVASRAAAAKMVAGYGVVFLPVLKSRHIDGLAVDMTITWQGNLSIATANGSTVTISSLPREGAHNPELHRVGATYGVIKLVTDAPHWSVDGH
jgi:hypothetical protein